MTTLLLLVNVISLSISGPLGSDTVKSLEGPGLTNGLEGLELLHVVGELHSSGSLDDGLDRHHLSGQLDSLRQLLGSGVALAGLLGVEREQDQLGLVFLQALSVQLQRLHALVPATVVDSDADGLGVVLAKPSSLQLLKGEPF